MKIDAVGMFVLLLLLTSTIASCSALTNFDFGGKSGDWIEYNLQNTIISQTGEQERLDFQSVLGTNVTVQATSTPSLPGMDITDTLDLTTQDDFPMMFLTARAYFIPGGLSRADSVYLGAALGTRNITDETTKTYAGVSRTVIYANFSDNGDNYVLYWDKQTGVLTEGTRTLGIASEGVVINATNMWGAELAWLLWISIIAAIALGVLSSRKALMKKLRRKPEAQAPSTKVRPVTFPSKRKC